MLNKYNMLSGSITKASRFIIGTAFVVWQGATLAPAATLDFFGPPPAGDPSAFTGPFIGLNFAQALLATLPPPNEGSFLGGPTGTAADAGINNVLPVALQTNANVPTNSKPSPLFGAQSFTQKMLLFEEFGTEPLDSNTPTPLMPFPAPTLGAAPEQDPSSVAMSGPAGADLEAFLSQGGIAPFPTQFSNTLDVNPWKQEIEGFLGRRLHAPPAEGRPPGQGWSHQRWNEFFPQVFYKTAP